MQDSLLSKATDPQYSDIAKDIIWLFIPRVSSNLLSTLGNEYLVSLLSNLSPQEDFSAASGLISGVRLVLIVIPSGFSYVVPVLFKTSENGPMVMTNALCLAMMLGLTGAVISLNISYFFRIIGVDKSVCDIVQDYFYVFSPVFPIQLMSTVMNQVAPSVKADYLLYIDSGLNLFFLVIFSSLVLNVDNLLFLSKTQLIAFSSLASSSSRWMVYFIAYAYKGGVFENLFSLHLNQDRWCQFCSILSSGAMTCLQLGSELMGSFFLSILVTLMLRDKKVNLDILNVMNQFFVFSVVIPIALGVTGMIKVSSLKKGDQPQLIAPYVKVLLSMAACYNFMIFPFTMCFTQPIVALFMNPSDNEHVGLSGSFRVLFMITCLGLLFDSFKNIINMAYRGLGLNQLAMEVSVTGVWCLGLPLAVVLALSFPSDLNIAGMLLGLNIGNVFMGGCLLWYWFGKKNTEKDPSLWRDCKNYFFGKKDSDTRELVESYGPPSNA